MNEKLIEKLSWSIGFLIVFTILGFIGLLGWGFIELVQWITSK